MFSVADFLGQTGTAHKYMLESHPSQVEERLDKKRKGCKVGGGVGDTKVQEEAHCLRHPR